MKLPSSSSSSLDRSVQLLSVPETYTTEPPHFFFHLYVTASATVTWLLRLLFSSPTRGSSREVSQRPSTLNLYWYVPGSNVSASTKSPLGERSIGISSQLLNDPARLTWLAPQLPSHLKRTITATQSSQLHISAGRVGTSLMFDSSFSSMTAGCKQSWSTPLMPGQFGGQTSGLARSRSSSGASSVLCRSSEGGMPRVLSTAVATRRPAPTLAARRELKGLSGSHAPALVALERALNWRLWTGIGCLRVACIWRCGGALQAFCVHVCVGRIPIMRWCFLRNAR
mmetsp:Transcript_20889/g.39704  ORF Transcript_20889/g.39704 Transcript_20889/m.39704 type:complete len:283 (+) Transcript_20889:2081-2929(+)